MMQTLVMVNAEDFWEGHFSDQFEVHHVRLQTSKWMLRNNVLHVYDNGKRIRVDNIFWRIAPVLPHQYHREILEMIRFSGVPCVNPTHTMLDEISRWTMLNRLKSLGLPMLSTTFVVGSILAQRVHPTPPAVLKVGSYHAGYGKLQIQSTDQWNDVSDFLFSTDGYFTVEPFVDYKRDIRCLAVGDKVWSMARKGSRWKANTGVVDTQSIDIPDVLLDYTKRVQDSIGADIIALDILETDNGEYFVLESNVVPGLAGFSQTVIYAIVDLAIERFTSV